LFVLADVTRPTIVTLAARSRIPAIYGNYIDDSLSAKVTV
jgi:hypothetical protein